MFTNDQVLKAIINSKKSFNDSSLLRSSERKIVKCVSLRNIRISLSKIMNKPINDTQDLIMKINQMVDSGLLVRQYNKHQNINYYVIPEFRYIPTINLSKRCYFA